MNAPVIERQNTAEPGPRSGIDWPPNLFPRYDGVLVIEDAHLVRGWYHAYGWSAFKRRQVDWFGALKDGLPAHARVVFLSPLDAQALALDIMADVYRPGLDTAPFDRPLAPQASEKGSVAP